jgi:hypothetical protein
MGQNKVTFGIGEVDIGRRADVLVNFTSFHVSSRFGPPPTIATLPW